MTADGDVEYVTRTTDLESVRKDGFFVGWPNPPSDVTLERLIRGSAHVVAAVDRSANRLVGFVTAVSDGVLCAYIPLLEVLPEYQGRGIGKELMQRMLDTLSGHYMIDLLCDERMQTHYERLGMKHAHGMMIRRYEKNKRATTRHTEKHSRRFTTSAGQGSPRRWRSRS